MSHALVVDDEDLTLRYLERFLAEEGFEVTTTSSVASAKSELRRGLPDVLLVDLVLPDGKGLDLLAAIEPGAAVEVVVITGHASVDSVVEALHLGASDYLTKPIDEHRLRTILKHVRRIRGLRDEVGELHERLRVGRLGPLVGQAPAIQRVCSMIRKVAPTNATVLVTGESGSGKELVAQTIHDYSRRSEGPFVAINCGAISPQLIESELFGHEKGSFTGATAQRKGHFENAHGGTLFLDEVAEMPLELQVKLLRVLETGTFMRTGGDTRIEVDVRVVAATNRAPQAAISEGYLREDLYYRINVFSIELPPLRERREDVVLLAAQFLASLNREEGTAKRLGKETSDLLTEYSWPGNVRQLKNVVQRAFILTPGEEITPEVLPVELQCARVPRTARESPAGESLSFDVGTPLAEFERRAILATLKHHGGNKKKTAQTLGINLRTLYNRLKSYREDVSTAVTRGAPRPVSRSRFSGESDNGGRPSVRTAT